MVCSAAVLPKEWHRRCRRARGPLSAVKIKIRQIFAALSLHENPRRRSCARAIPAYYACLCCRSAVLNLQTRVLQSGAVYGGGWCTTYSTLVSIQSQRLSCHARSSFTVCGYRVPTFGCIREFEKQDLYLKAPASRPDGASAQVWHLPPLWSVPMFSPPVQEQD